MTVSSTSQLLNAPNLLMLLLFPSPSQSLTRSFDLLLCLSNWDTASTMLLVSILADMPTPKQHTAVGG